MCASYSVLPVVSTPVSPDNRDMSTTPSPFSKWLIQARRRVGVSQQQLADMTGIDRGHLSKIETGRVSMPLYETRQRIHAALNTSEAELLELGIVQRDVAAGARNRIHHRVAEAGSVYDVGDPRRPHKMILDEIDDPEALTALLHYLIYSRDTQRRPAPVLEPQS